MIIDVVLSAVKKYNDAEHKWSEVNADSIVHGPSGPLDSLAFISCMIEIEKALREEYGVDARLMRADRFLNRADDPYRTVRSIANLASETIVEGAKCIVCDLDGTLWDGVAGENEQVTYKTGTMATLKALKDRGMILAIATANKRENTERMFVDGLPLSLKDFTACRYVAVDKADAVKKIAASLNILTESVVLLDDDPAIRDWVEITTDARAIENVTGIDFPTKQVTAEDRERAEMYMAEFRRKTDYEAMPTEVWMSTLQTVVTVTTPKTDEDVARAAQLFAKTNQFITDPTRRATAEDISRLDTIIARASDKYGDMGIIFAAVINHHLPPDVTVYGRDPQNGIVANACLSCRVFNRGIEDAIYSVVQNYARCIGLVKGEKNGYAIDAMDRIMPGVLDHSLVCPKWIEVRDEI